MTRPKLLATLVLIATILFVISPWLTPGFNGFDTDRFPVPQIDPPVQPAGYAFAIWGLIYLWLIVGGLYGLFRASEDDDWQAMRPALLASLLVGIFWITVANTSPVWATVMIVFMAATAILAFLRSGHYDALFQTWPVALYAGWLTAATGVGIGVLLGGYGLLSPQSAAFLCLVGVLTTALLVQSERPENWGYPAALVWALAGVIVGNLPNSNWPVIMLAGLGGIALLVRPTLHAMKEK